MAGRAAPAVLATVLLAVWAAPAHAQSVITEVPPGSLADLGAAIVDNPAFINDIDFAEGGAGTTAIGSGDPLGGFPLSAASYGILTTGDPSLAPTANSSGTSGAAVSGAPTPGRGGGAFDSTVLTIALNVPQGATCLEFTYRFFSDEAGGPGNGDAFLAQLDSNTWSLTGTSLNRPGDFAAAGPNPVGVPGAGDLTMQAALAAGTTYDAGTDFLVAKTPVTPGAHNLFLSIFDAGDPNVDSAVFIGRLGFTAEGPASCHPPSGLLRSAPPSGGIASVRPLPPLRGRAAPLPAGPGSVPRTRIPRNNKFRVLRVIRLADGSLRLRVRVPRRGVLSAAFAGRRGSVIRRVRKVVRRRGVVSLRIRPNAAGVQRLRRAARLHALVRIKFTPRGGVPLTEIHHLTLRRP